MPICCAAAMESSSRAPFGYRYRWSLDRKSTRLNSSHSQISYAVFCLKKKNTTPNPSDSQLDHELLFRNHDHAQSTDRLARPCSRLPLVASRVRSHPALSRGVRHLADD